MSFKIVVDSCCELPEPYKSAPNTEFVPLGISVGDYHIMDDETFNQAEFLQKVREYEGCPKSSCPSPDRYLRAYDCEYDDIYVVTLSSHLSGSYNSALLGKNLYHEEKGEKNIHIFDSESASGGEAQVAMTAWKYASQGLPFEEVIEKTEEFRDNQKTYFILDSLEALRKNGRMSNVKAMVATTLNIKPVMGGVHGVIELRGQAIGMKKAFIKMIEIMMKEATNPEERHLVITHCNCAERAQVVRDMILKKIPFKDSLVMDTNGISSLYASDGGIIVTC